MNTHTVSKKRSFRYLWRRPRIVAVDALELIESPPTPACAGRWTGKEATDGAYHRRYLALTARWKGLDVGGATLEIRNRTAVVRLLHVDEAWRQYGVGRRLLRGLLQRARFQLVSDVYVLATVADAGFYALHGFRPVDEEEDTRDPTNGFDFTGRNGRSTDEDAYRILHRRLTSPFVSMPYEGITVKMGLL